MFEIIGKHSVVDGRQEVTRIFTHVNAHDMRGLACNRYFKDAACGAACQEINRKLSNVFAVDPLAASKLVNSLSLVMPYEILFPNE